MAPPAPGRAAHKPQHRLEGDAQFRILVESVRDYAIFMLDPQGRVMTWNAGAERIKGYSAEDILGEHFSRFYTPEAMERNWPAHELKVAAAEGRFEDEGWRVRKDGTRFWANVVITAVRDAGGRLIGFSKVTRDLTERRANEERIRALNVQLENRLIELVNSNRELEQKNRENEAFVYSVSHDVRQPLVNLQGFSKELELATGDLRRLLGSPGLPREVAAEAAHPLDLVDESVHYIGTSVMHLGRIIDGLLRLSRVGRVEYELQPLDLGEIVRRLVAAMHGTIVAHRAEVTVGGLPKVLGDPAAIEQAFANLLANALNYLEPSRPGRIEVGASPDAPIPGTVRVHVRDNGVGIPAAMHANIFRVFQRLRPELASGEGMGLAIVQRIVERHGGMVEFESEEGVGTTFHLTLPAADV